MAGNPTGTASPWHTTLLAKSSVLYLCEGAGSGRLVLPEGIGQKKTGAGWNCGAITAEGGSLVQHRSKGIPFPLRITAPIIRATCTASERGITLISNVGIIAIPPRENTAASLHGIVCQHLLFCQIGRFCEERNQIGSQCSQLIVRHLCLLQIVDNPIHHHLRRNPLQLHWLIQLLLQIVLQIDVSPDHQTDYSTNIRQE